MPFFQLSDIRPHPLVNGITIKGVSGDNISVSFLEFPPGAAIPPHRHANEQIGIVEEGELQYTIGDHSMICRRGMAFLIPPNTLHSALVVSSQPVHLLDVFTPPRRYTEPLRYESR